jgi:hypothetical protein
LRIHCPAAKHEPHDTAAATFSTCDLMHDVWQLLNSDVHPDIDVHLMERGGFIL